MYKQIYQKEHENENPMGSRPETASGETPATGL